MMLLPLMCAIGMHASLCVSTNAHLHACMSRRDALVQTILFRFLAKAIISIFQYGGFEVSLQACRYSNPTLAGAAHLNFPPWPGASCLPIRSFCMTSFTDTLPEPTASKAPAMWRTWTCQKMKWVRIRCLLTLRNIGVLGGPLCLALL